MNNFSIVDVLHTKANLCEPVQYLGFCKWLPSLLFAFLLQIAAISEIHDDA
jgi:hypothetical protein